ESALHFVGARAQTLNLAVDDQVVDGEHFARGVYELVHAPGDLRRLHANAWHACQEVVQRLLVPHRTVERAELRVVERQQADLFGELPEAPVHPRVALQQVRVVEHRGLLRQPLDRADALNQRAAGARRLGRVEYGAAALASEALGIPRGVEIGRAH